MVTIKQLADELGVSKQAVYSRVTKEPLKTTLESMTDAIQTSAQGAILLSEEGANIVRNAYAEKYQRPGEVQRMVSSNKVPKVAEYSDAKFDNLLLQVSSMQNAVSTLLDHTLTKDAKISALEEQITEKNTRIVDLTKVARRFSENSADKESELQNLKNKLEQAEEQALTLEKQLSELQKQLSEQEKQLNEQEKQLSEQQKQLNERQQQLNERQHQLSEREKEPPIAEPLETPNVQEADLKPEPTEIQEVPQLDESFDQLDDLFEPLLSFSDDDFSSPSNRFSKLLTK